MKIFFFIASVLESIVVDIIFFSFHNFFFFTFIHWRRANIRWIKMVTLWTILNITLLAW